MKGVSRVVQLVRNPPSKWRRCKRHRLDSWIWKILWRRKWQPTPVFLPGKFHGWAWWATVHKVTESDTTEWLHFHFTFLGGRGEQVEFGFSCLLGQTSPSHYLSLGYMTEWINRRIFIHLSQCQPQVAYPLTSGAHQALCSALFSLRDWEDHRVQMMQLQESGDSGSLSVCVEEPLPAHMAQGWLLTQHSSDHPDFVVQVWKQHGLISKTCCMLSINNQYQSPESQTV